MYHRRTVGLRAIRRITKRIRGVGFNLLKPGGVPYVPPDLTFRKFTFFPPNLRILYES